MYIKDILRVHIKEKQQLIPDLFHKLRKGPFLYLEGNFNLKKTKEKRDINSAC